MSLRIEDENGRFRIDCDFCVNSYHAENLEDPESEFEACGWTEEDEENYCPICSEERDRRFGAFTEDKRELCKFCKRAARVSTGTAILLACV